MIEPCPAPDVRRRLPANPFATRFTRPGRLAIRDRDGAPLDLRLLEETLDRLGGRAAIEGPHGSGKTTLLVAIADRLEARRRLARLVRLRGRRDARQALSVLQAAPPGSVLCLDSWEQAGRWTAAAIRWTAWRRAVGLVVTSHRPTGFPLLHRGSTSPVLLARLVADLPPHGGVITAADVVAAHVRHDGDLRAAFFDLYDRFEARIR